MVLTPNLRSPGVSVFVRNASAPITPISFQEELDTSILAPAPCDAQSKTSAPIRLYTTNLHLLSSTPD